jgi:two-component system, response regulator PdtaR
MAPRPQVLDDSICQHLEFSAMPSLSTAHGENVAVPVIDLFGRNLATDARSAYPVTGAAQPTGFSLPTRPTNAPRVLVVEDDAMIGVLLGEMLEGMGYDVCGIEATEADAVTAAARYRPDLMIVDVQLGEGSGVSAVDTIHRAGPVPHVFVSGDIAKLRALEPGSITIQKPYREFELALVIQRALAGRSVS